MPSIENLTPQELLAIADKLLTEAVPGTAGTWPRTVAFLVRLALEQSIDEFWAAKAPGVQECQMRPQLICLREYAEPAVAARAASVWGALSSACHYHHYDLAATASELRSWHREVRAIREALVRTG